MKLASMVSGLVTATLLLAGPASADDGGDSWSFRRYLAEAHSLGHVTITVGVDYMQVDWEGLRLGPEASRDLRDLADGALSGESDGHVDPGEAEDFLFALRELFTVEFGKYANHHAFSGFVLIDQAEAQGVEATHVEAAGLEGPVEQEATVSASLGVRIAFPNVDDHKDLHTIRVDLGPFAIPAGGEDQAASMIGDLTVTVRPEEGWTIDAESVQPECAAEAQDGNQLVFSGDDIDCFTGHEGVLLSFVITGKGKPSDNFLPGFEAVLVGLAGLGAGALVRRRR